MKTERSFDGRWRVGVMQLAPCLMLLAATGCDFEAIGGANGMPPGLGCSKDLEVSSLSIDLTPPIGGYVVGGATPAPTNSEFHESHHAFGIDWHYQYDGFFTPGPAKHAYTTLVQILKNDVVVWELEVDAEPVDTGDEGWDSVYVWDGLPVGFYTARVELDPHGSVPECGDLVTIGNNVQMITFNVWGPSGQPQNPTPCQESEDPNCVDGEDPPGR